MKFVHAADLHLDSPLRGLEAYKDDGAPVERIRTATRQAFRNLIDLCLVERADFLLLCGDVFDDDWRDFRTGLFFTGQLMRLAEADIHVYLVRGNHDSASEVTRNLKLPAHVTEFSPHAPETAVREDLGVALHGRSFPRRAVTENWVTGYPAPRRGLLNIGLLHTSAAGSAEHATYAPCSIDELAGKGYQYWALGHVHQHQVLHESPWVVFSGNTQGRHVNERGVKGCVIVKADAGEVTDVRHVPLDVLRWQRINVAAEEADDLDALLGRVDRRLREELAAVEGRLLAVRLNIAGACAAHDDVVKQRTKVNNELRNLTVAGDVWLEQVTLATRPPVRLDELRASEGFVGELLRSIESLRGDPTALTTLVSELKPLRDKLAAELEAAGVDLDSPAYLAEVLGEAEAALVCRLAGASP
jgi:DNA repair protein SbcD/Mre11